MICIIPARKNSKGLKNKNIKKLKGIPLIEHSVQIAKKSKKITEIYISTDNKKIIKYFEKDISVKIPFLRPKELSKDSTKSIDVYLHMIKYLELRKKVENFCVLLPTCPIRSPKLIDQAIRIFNKKKPKYLISVVKTKPLEFQFKLTKKKYLKKIKNIKTSVENRQKLDHIYSPNGNLYIFNTNALKKDKNFMTSKTYCFEMNKYFSQDIDDKVDFSIVKKLI
jgi:CMP-N,N'-diacetyllegionaminic acid synthase